MFGGISSSTSSSSSTHTTSRREDKLEEETEKPTTTSTTSISTSSSNSNSCWACNNKPPAVLLDHFPILKLQYDQHFGLHATKQFLIEMIENTKKLNEELNRRDEAAAVNASTIHQRVDQASTPVFRTPLVPQAASTVAGLPFTFLPPLNVNPLQTSQLSLLTQSQSFVPQIQTSPLVFGLSAYSLNHLFPAQTQSAIQDPCQQALAQARTLDMEGQVVQAECIYQQMIQSGITDVRLLEDYGKFLSKHQKFAEAEIYLQNVMQIKPSPEIGKEYSYCLLRQGKRVEAKQQIEAVLAKMQPTDPLYSLCQQIRNCC